MAASWDGSAWTLDTVPLPAGASVSALDGVSCVAGGACTAFGTYGTVADFGLPLAERLTQAS